METPSGTRRAWPFKFCIASCIQFVLLTGIAMLLYPGGSAALPKAHRYSFSTNFFSDLGMTVTFGGNVNRLSAILFVVTLTLAGLGLIVFFVAAPRLFRRSRVVHALTLLGSVFGVVSGLAYIGIAFTPANLMMTAHFFFVQIAFHSFLAVVMIYSIAIFLNPEYPNIYAFVYLLFAALLAAYIRITYHPDFGTLRGVTVQAVWQKIIAYAAILCALVQNIGALRLSRDVGSRGRE
jgi:hypothetical protein